MGIFDVFGKGKTLYYPGCLLKGSMKKKFENYKEIFKRLGIGYVLLEDSICCGLPVFNSGHRKDARKFAEKNFKLFKEKGIRKIVTSCPSCYYMFREVYPKLVREWSIEVEHATVSVLRGLKKKGIKFRGSGEEREIVSYHDPCYLGRHSGIYEEPREVIRLLGGEIREFPLNRESAICCGAGGGVLSNFPKTAKKVASKKMSFVPGEIAKVISPCALCHSNFKSESDKSVEFSSFVLGKLRGMK